MLIRKRKDQETVDTPENAIHTAVSLLACKENTKKELIRKLTIRGYSKENAEIAVRFAVEKGYLSEIRYIERYVEYCVENLYGRTRIMVSLKQKGFDSELISKDLFESYDFKEYCYAALKRFKKSDPKKARASLMRRGYSSAEVTYSLKRYLQEYGIPYGSDFAEEPEEDPFSEDDDI